MKKRLLFILTILTTLLAKAQIVNSPYSSPANVSPPSNSYPSAPVYVPAGNSQSASSQTSSAFTERNTRYNNQNADLTSNGMIDNGFWLGKRFFRDTVFHQGELRTRKGIIGEEISFRYDQIVGAMEVKLENGKRMYLIDKDILYCKIFFDDHTAVFLPVVLPNEKLPILVEVIYKTPTLQLYRNLHKIEEAGATYTGNVDIVDNRRDNYAYYFRKGDKEKLHKININAKSFINMLPNKRHYILELFKEVGKDKLTIAKLTDMMNKLDNKREDN